MQWLSFCETHAGSLVRPRQNCWQLGRPAVVLQKLEQAARRWLITLKVITGYWQVAHKKVAASNNATTT
jgi:hypothetical protein